MGGEGVGIDWTVRSMREDQLVERRVRRGDVSERDSILDEYICSGLDRVQRGGELEARQAIDNVQNEREDGGYFRYLDGFVMTGQKTSEGVFRRVLENAAMGVEGDVVGRNQGDIGRDIVVQKAWVKRRRSGRRRLRRRQLL